MADFCLVECGWFSAEIRTYPATRTGSVLFLGMRTLSVPISCYRFLLEAVYIMCVDGVNNASRSKWLFTRIRSQPLLAEGKVLRILLEPLRRTDNVISIIKKTSVRPC